MIQLLRAGGALIPYPAVPIPFIEDRAFGSAGDSHSIAVANVHSRGHIRQREAIRLVGFHAVRRSRVALRLCSPKRSACAIHAPYRCSGPTRDLCVVTTARVLRLLLLLSPSFPSSLGQLSGRLTAPRRSCASLPSGRRRRAGLCLPRG